MAERPSMGWNTMTTATKILLIGGLLFFIDLFLPWYSCSLAGTIGCGTASGWHGALGVLVGIIIILILVMEVLIVLGVPVNVGTPAMRNQIEGVLAMVLLVLTFLHVLLKPSAPSIVHVGWEIWAWIGLILSAVIAYGGYMRWQEAKVTTPPPIGADLVASR